MPKKGNKVKRSGGKISSKSSSLDASVSSASSDTGSALRKGVVRSSSSSWISDDSETCNTNEKTPATLSKTKVIAETSDTSSTLNSSVQPRSISFQEAKSNTVSKGRKPRTGGRQRRDKSLENVIDLKKSGLCEAIINNPLWLIEIVNLWMKKYIEDRTSATLMILQLIVDSSGATFCITSQMLESMDFKEIVRRMTEEDKDDNWDYPLTMSGRWKNFDGIYDKFLTMLVRRSQSFIIEENSFMEKLIMLLTELSYSHVRAYRHTAVFAAVKLTLALLDISVGISRENANIRRQHERERQNIHENRSMENDMNAEEIYMFIDWTMKNIFANRCVDFAREIRLLCISVFGHYALKNHERFLDDNYLCHIENRLHDDDAEVRLRCLEILQSFYDHQRLSLRLVNFTSNIKNRVVAMTCDKDNDVAVHAVKLINFIGKLYEDILGDDDCEHIYKLVYSANRDVARAAGEFVNERLFKSDISANNASIICDIVTFFIESELPEHAIFLVDSLIETIETLKDWKCMSDILLDAGPDDEHATRLIEIMYCCVKSATGEHPIRRATSRKMNSAKILEQVQENKRKLAEHFITVLPLLLERYGADPEKIGFLVALPRYFDLEIYTKNREEANLDELLRLMSEIVEKFNHIGILGNVAKSLELMCNEQLGIFHPCDVARSLILDHVYDEYKKTNESYSKIIDESENFEDNMTFDFLQSLKKLVIFCTVHDMNSYDIWESLWKILESVKFAKESLPDEAIVCCIQACYSIITRGQINIIKTEDSSIRLSNEVKQLSERLHSFMDLMLHFIGGDANISDVSISQIIREEAYSSICDMLIFFNKTLLNYKNPVVHQLIYTADNVMQNALNRFVQENVFAHKTNDECSIEEYHKRRKFLSGFCKLAMCTMIPLISTADVLKHYVEYYEKYGDIMKEAIGLFRDRNRTSCALLLLRSLEILYAERRDEAIDEMDKIETRMLAKRFALLFGLDPNKNEDAFVTLHQCGFKFATASPDNDENDLSKPPKNLSFLEILIEFSARLAEAGKIKVLSFVEMKFPRESPMWGDEEWGPLHLYRNSLMPGGGRRAVRTKNTGAVRKIIQAEGNEGTSQLSKTSIHESTAKPKKKKAAKKTPLSVSKITHPAASTLVTSHTVLTPDFSCSNVTTKDSIQDDDSQTQNDGELFKDLTE